MAQVYEEYRGPTSRAAAAESWESLPERSGGGIVLLALAITAVFGALGAAGIEVVAFLLG
ncbi:MAG: hypothetical protein L0Y54_07310 [Sporichthyaceae bacterium]|nr:hypothetical protein [Sporichthyaceae bacterium]